MKSYTEQDITDNMGLVYKIAHDMAPRHTNSLMDFGDLVSEGVFGLVKAFQRFDPEKKVRFSTYASWLIRCAILEAHRQAFKQYRQARRFRLLTPTYLYLDASSQEDGSLNHEVLQGEFLSEEDIIARIDSDLVVEKAWNRLTPKQKTIMSLMLKNGLTQKETAEKLGVTPTAVWAQYHKALGRIRNYHMLFKSGR